MPVSSFHRQAFDGAGHKFDGFVDLPFSLVSLSLHLSHSITLPLFVLLSVSLYLCESLLVNDTPLICLDWVRVGW